MSIEERLGLMIDRETIERDSRRILTRLRQTRLRQDACVENIDFSQHHSPDKTLIKTLISGKWLKEHLNILITGPFGVGESFLASALAHKTCFLGRSALYVRAPRLFNIWPWPEPVADTPAR